VLRSLIDALPAQVAENLGQAHIQKESVPSGICSVTCMHADFESMYAHFENLGQDPNHKTGPFFWTNTFAAARACMAAEEVWKKETGGGAL